MGTFNFSLMDVAVCVSVCFSLDAWLNEASSEGGVDSGAHGHVGSLTDGGVTLGVLQAAGAAQAHVAHSPCRNQTQRYSSQPQGQQVRNTLEKK